MKIIKTVTAPALAFGMAALVTGLLATSPPAQAQPAGQTIRIIFPFAAGGAGDAAARILGEKLAKATGNAVIIENRTGAGGRIGIKAVRDSAPDGTTILFTAFAPMSLYPHFYGDKLDFDPVKDFKPVSQPTTFEFALGVANNVPANNIKELQAWLKADSKRATFGVPAAGTLPHFLGLQLGKALSVDMQVLPFRGSPLAVNEVAAGQVPMAVTNSSDMVSLHAAGRMKVLGTFTDKRSVHVKGVPTMREQGVDLVGHGWYGMYLPSKTPDAIVTKYSKVFADAVRDPEVSARLSKLGLDPTGTTGPELAAIQKRDHDYWGPIIKASGFKPKQ